MSTSVTRQAPQGSFSTIIPDLTAGVVVFLVALPLCLGIALASNAPLISGILAGVVGGILVGMLSGSHTSVSGPAAGLTAIVASQIATQGSFQAFLVAVLVAGVIQIVLGVIKAGMIAAFFPTSVIKGLLAAIGVILILKQLPYVLGHQSFDKEHHELEGDLTYNQPGHENPFLSLLELLDGEYHLGPLVIGLVSIFFLVVWDRIEWLKKAPIPSPLIVVLLGVLASYWFNTFGSVLAIGAKQHVQVPEAESLRAFFGLLPVPDFSALSKPATYLGGLTLAIVASLETLLNLEAVDKIDPRRRESPANRELIAQGIGNCVAGLIGALPMTSVIVRSSVNINAGARTKLSAIFHGFLLFGFVLFIPKWLNMIPLSSLAAILMVTGFKLASPKLVKQLYLEGRYQFLPFVITVIAIVMTDLLIGILIGLGTALAFILASNYRRPVRRIIEKHIEGNVVHIELANQVSFLNRAALERTLRDVPPGEHVLLDARQTDYIDPDILSLIRDFKEHISKAHGVTVSLRGFRPKYQLHDDIQYIDYSTRELQGKITPEQVIEVLKAGNERFRNDQRLNRNVHRIVMATSEEQHPMAVILSCMDSRIPPELIFDLGIGDVFNIRIAGNALVGPKVMASTEFGCTVGGAKLIVVLGHTRSVVIEQALLATQMSIQKVTETYGKHFALIVDSIRPSLGNLETFELANLTADERYELVDRVTRTHVGRVVRQIVAQSELLQQRLRHHQVAIIAAVYNVLDGSVEFLDETGQGLPGRREVSSHGDRRINENQTVEG